ncbi:MAG: hypothetical protein K0S61_3756 [Anaerocolumna sp.]|nr:hypothetical protein [Anaerocolumna sp.]
MKLIKWAYIILGIGVVSFIFIMLSGVNVIFPVIGALIFAGGLILSHIICRCPNCDQFINVGIVLEASRKIYHCHKCGKTIDTDTKIQL